MTSMCYENLAKDDPDLAKALADAGKVIVLSQAVSRNEVITGAMDQIHKAGGQAVLLSLNLPYDAACYEEADAVLCAYQPYGSAHDAEGNGPFNLNVAVALCTAYNEAVPSGTLPVNVPPSMYRRSAEREKISPLKTSFCTSAGSGWKSGETKERAIAVHTLRENKNTKHSEIPESIRIEPAEKRLARFLNAER